MADWHKLGDVIDVEKYGVGVPFAMLLLAIGLMIYAFRGSTAWATLTPYGKIGVVTLAVLSVVSFIISGYTFRRVDVDWFVDRKTDRSENHNGGDKR